MDELPCELLTALCIVVTSCAVLLGMKTKLKPKQKRWWVRPWIMKRDDKGAYSLINEEFEADNDPESFKNFLRMDRETFQKLLELVKDDIQKQSTLMRSSISPKNRLILTLHFLATGESYRSLRYYFRIGFTTISIIIPEVCSVLYQRLKINYLKAPTTAAEWLDIAKDFQTRWNFPNALGAMDGKHIIFAAPREAGSEFFNYRHQNSIVLLAVVDSKYKFTYIDCGTIGMVSDGGVFQKSLLASAIETNSINIPEESQLPGRRNPMPFVFLADAAFPLQKNILKPFPFRNLNNWEQRIYNYRLSRARRVVENAFGILLNRWWVLLTTINLAPEKVQTIVQTCCALHNFVLTECPSDVYEPENERFDFIYGLSQQGGNRPRNEALHIRTEFMEFFNNEGAVDWQNNIA